MSTVALRGTISHDETQHVWTWTGVWGFGTSLADVSSSSVAVTPTRPRTGSGGDGSAQRGPSHQPPPSQPFTYRWEVAAHPSAIPIPSLNLFVSGDGDDVDDGNDGGDDGDDDGDGDREVGGGGADDRKVGHGSETVATLDETKNSTSIIAGEIGHEQSAEIIGSGILGGTDAATNATKKEVSISEMAKASSTDATIDKTRNVDPMESNETVISHKPHSAKNVTTKEDSSSSPNDHHKTKPRIESKLTMETVATSQVTTKERKADIDATTNVGYDGNHSSVSAEPNQMQSDAPATLPATYEASASAPSVVATDSSRPSQPPGNDQPLITFESVIPNFTDASAVCAITAPAASAEDDTTPTIQRLACPPSGKWVGHFDNVTGRNRDKVHTQRVQETFYLFLNANPDADAKFTFDNSPSEHIPPPALLINCKSTSAGTATSSSTSSKSLVSPLVQVRGCGENQFGTFEIFGFLDLQTMVMEIQRQYVVVELPKKATPRRRRASSETGVARSSSDTTGRSYSKRKRLPSWKRKTYDPEEDAIHRRKTKRPKDSPQLQQPEQAILSSGDVSSPMRPQQLAGVATIPVVATSSATGPETTQGLSVTAGAPSTANSKIPSLSTDILPLATTGEGDANVKSLPVSAPHANTGPTQRMMLPTQKSSAASKTFRTASRPVASGNKRALSSSEGSGVRTKRSNTGTGSASPGGSSPYIRLPPVGDPKKARWRAAHFLYYQRQDADQHPQNGDDTLTSSGNASVSSSPRYVIYEGEMVDSKREGRGICLYNNGLLYEGEWKRNKEHGYGKLMSSDRKKIVYEGEWERGRMQGNGTYYYGSSDPDHPGSRYIGEFKENLRNGVGRYFLPNGSVYDGQWRDGVMSGRGIFSWPDNSVYDGEWKDGKRNGQGILKTSDGFIYDGFWVNNSMEGRGSAIYPNGQTYEGLFSNGRREGRGTMHFTNGAVYEGRFRDDAVDGQGTMKMSRVMVVPREQPTKDTSNGEGGQEKKPDFMIPISFQSDITHIHTRAGFTAHGE